jgi:hypothetical protein
MRETPMTKFFNSLGVRSAALLLMLLALAFSLTGCRSSLPDPRAFNTPPLNAYTLSGGKITTFIGNPYLPADPNAKALLKACRYLPLKSKTAQSADVIFHSHTGTQPISALIVDNTTLVLMGSVERMLNGEVDRTTASILNLPGGTKRAKIGAKWVTLKYPIVAIDHGTQTVVTLPDLLMLFQASDAHRGGGHEIQYLGTHTGLKFTNDLWRT